ncbi:MULTISPECIES: FliH/SctL family protein [Burkholderia]|uniref:FliH/SctL family protein n=1 Tax=unclassified Burkholderia TaxID=2613784 RepID=UPI000B79D56B|nr:MULTISPECIES: FliH/SctL family protein [unclassified Burkholderia]MBR8238346.1 flagellar assembly protein FliH [Burkholderia sp. AU32357]MBY4877497.1 flagellar assembly protein FliH [Burkholderia sp. AU42008]OXI37399.1 flagellar assembly protein FliH [Burkholderia sp. AU17457]
MRTYRRYAFPSLARIRAASEQLGGFTAPDEVDLLSEQLHVPPAAELLEEARQAGYEEGFAAGERVGAEGARRDVRSGFDALVAPVDALVRGFQRVQEAYRAKVRSEVAELVGDVARQVVRAELETRPERILAFVDEAVGTLTKPPESVSVRLNPADYARLAEAAPDRAQGWQLVPDDRLEPGECRVRADDIEMDAGCGQRLVACIERITSQLAHAHADDSDGVPA